MLSQTQELRYFERMKASLGDKALLLPHLDTGSVLDVGGGGGEVAAVLMEAGHDVVVLDGSEAAVKRVQSIGIPVMQGMSHEIEQLFPPKSFNNLLCSSVMHEVYSYGYDFPGTAYTLQSMEHTLKQFHNVLTPGGKLIIRDGVKPTNWNEQQVIKFTDSDGVKLLKKYMEMIPFKGAGVREVNLTVVDDFTATGNASSVMEFLYTYTWGESVFPRETQELYGVFTVEEYTSFLEQNGFEVENSFSYIQEGYPEHLVGKAQIYSPNGELLPYPCSQQVQIAVKR